MIPAISGASIDRFFGSGLLACVAGLAWCGSPTFSE
jgi:hypothetical protein